MSADAESANPAPTLTVVTICYNAVKSIGRTIDAVQAQTFADAEHLFIDGVSTDGALDVIRAKMRARDVLVSEPDKGISDAINKGIARARGRYVHLLHADDAIPADFHARAVDALEATGAPFVYGDLVMERNGAPYFRYVGEADYRRIIERRMPNLNHPTCVVRADVYREVGGFSPEFRCAMDYDWFLRCARAGHYGLKLDGLVAYMNVDGVSNARWRRTISEVRDIAMRHGRSPLLAWPEWAYRTVKTGIGTTLKTHADPLYVRLRALINPTVKSGSL